MTHSRSEATALGGYRVQYWILQNSVRVLEVW